MIILARMVQEIVWWVLPSRNMSCNVMIGTALAQKKTIFKLLLVLNVVGCRNTQKSANERTKCKRVVVNLNT